MSVEKMSEEAMREVLDSLAKIGKQWGLGESVGRVWEVVEKYISGQKCHEKIDTVPVIAEEKEKLRTHKTWYTSLYDKLFGGVHQK